MSMLDLVLAGPFIRCVSPNQVAIWIAASRKVDLVVSVGAEGTLNGGRQGSQSFLVEVEQQWIAVGTRVHLCLLQVSLLTPQTWPVDTGIRYHFKVADDEALSAQLGEKLQSQALAKQPGPFFYPMSEDDSLTWVASCRHLGTPGTDAFVGMRAKLIGEKQQKWPRKLMLCGDQIYADDVSDPVFALIKELHERLFEKKITTGDRRERVRKLGFSSDASGVHLLTFTEWVCLYLVSWSTTLVKSISEDKGLIAEVDAAETVMAHIPTYMMFDDHEVSDDWNIDSYWREGVEQKGGATLIESALLAYFIFQHWGNNPLSVDQDFLKKLQGAVDSKLDDEQRRTYLFKGYAWSYIIGGKVKSLVLDCRTTRSVDKDVVWLSTTTLDLILSSMLPRDQSLLCSVEELKRAKELLAGGVTEALILYLNTPLFTYPFQETIQSLSARFSRYLDAESWDAYPRSWTVLIDHLLRPLGITRLLIVAGDVHYSFSAEGKLSTGNWSCSCAQLTSSPMKNRDNRVPNILMVRTPKFGSSLSAAWLKAKRYLMTTQALPNELQYLAVIAAASIIDPDIHVKKWKIKGGGMLTNRPESDNSFTAFSFDSRKVRHSVLSSEAAELSSGVTSLD